MKNYTGLIRKKNPIVLEVFLLAQTKKRNTPLPLTTRMQTAAKKKWQTSGIERGKFAIVLFMHPNLVEF